jgi:outer membrane murein-binding lipoprotein Lpp
MVRNKRQALTQTPSPTPPSPPFKNITMDSTMAEMNAKLDLLCGSIQKINEIEATVKSMDTTVKALVQENQALRADLVARDEKIQSLTDQLNRLDQSSRSNSLRILGLPVSTQSTTANIIDTVYKEILLPTIEAAKRAGDLPEQAVLPPYSIISNAFTIPAKNSNSSPVILKLNSELIRAIVFKHKKEALPTHLDTATNRVRNKYSVFEDLSPATHAQFRTFQDDIRVKSVWSYGGQVRFKLQDSDTVYKAKSLSDTYDSLVKH